MGWDWSDNKRVDDTLRNHVAITRFLPRSGYNADGEPEDGGREPHPLKFDLSTPKRITHAIQRIMDPEDGVVPTSEELIKSRNECWITNLKGIWDVKGVRVPGNGNRNGRRADPALKGKRGGARKKKPAQMAKPLHPDAQKAAEMKRANWSELFAKKKAAGAL